MIYILIALVCILIAFNAQSAILLKRSRERENRWAIMNEELREQLVVTTQSLEETTALLKQQTGQKL